MELKVQLPTVEDTWTSPAVSELGANDGIARTGSNITAVIDAWGVNDALVPAWIWTVLISVSPVPIVEAAVWEQLVAVEALVAVPGKAWMT